MIGPQGERWVVACPVRAEGSKPRAARRPVAIDRLLALDARVMLPGHGAASSAPRQDIELTRDYLRFLRESMREAALNLEPFDAAYARTDWSRDALPKPAPR